MLFGSIYDHVCWCHQHGVLQGSHIPAAISADWWSAVALLFRLANRALGGLGALWENVRVTLKEASLFVVVAHGGGLIATNDAVVGLLGCLAHGSDIRACIQQRHRE